MNKDFNLGQLADAFGQRLLCDYKIFSLLASVVQTNTIDAIVDQCKLAQLGFTSISSHFVYEAVEAGDAFLM